MARATYRQDPETGKFETLEFLEEKYGTARPNKNHLIMPDIKEFRSPITGEIISSRPKLKAHNRKHGVTNSEDYSQEYMVKRSNERVKKAKGQTSEDKAERIELIKHQLEKQRGR